MTILSLNLKNNPEAEPLQWIARATPKNDARYYLNTIVADKDRVYSTDGHRLHIWNVNLKLLHQQARFWKIVKKTKNVLHLEPIIEDADYRYPDIDRVIPKMVKPIDLDARVIEYAFYAVMRDINDRVSSETRDDTLWAVNYNYFTDAYSFYPEGIKVDQSWKFTAGATGGALRLDKGPFTAIVMPLRAGKRTV